MKDKKLKVFFDTSFFIRLFKSDDPDHAKARAYWSRFRKEGSELFLSTIVAAEFGVAGTIKHLPYKYVTVLPFNLNHAERSSAMAQLAFENKRKGALQVASSK
jgi:predicted nucleic acid-binding protein